MTRLQVHGSWLPAQEAYPGAFAFWAEALPAPKVLRRHRPSASAPRTPRRHPFTAGAVALETILGSAGARLSPSELLIRLPTANGAPLSSDTPLPGPPAPDLTLWRIPALLLDAPEAIERLLSLAHGPSAATARLDEDLRFWALTARLVLDLLAAQHFMPGLQRLGDAYLARWEPWMQDGHDRRRLDALIASMPAICRSLARTREEPIQAAQSILDSFLEAAVDGLARQAIKAESAAVPVRRRSSRNQFADSWLDALRGAPQLTGQEPAASPLYEQYQAWRGFGQSAAEQDSFRVCFRLDPPAETAAANPAEPQPAGADAKPWTLEFLLQATDDPSLLVPAADVWRSRTSTASFVNRRFDHPQERLLTALGRATRLFPPVERSLQTSRPNGCWLSVDEAYDFVRESALLLRDSGFAVLVPGLQSKLGLRVRLGSRKTPQQSQGPSVLGWDALVDYDWQLAIGDQTFSREEFEALARLKEPLVQVRGQWIELRPEQVERALALFDHQNAGGGLSVQEALRLALAPDGDLGLPIVEVETAGWIDDLLGHLRDNGASGELVDDPPGFSGQLRPYQKTGASWLATLSRYGIGACLADDMGLGKTVQLIALLLHQKAHAVTLPAPTLLICPTSVVGNWLHELARFAPGMPVLVHHGAERVRDDFAAEAARHDVVISTYALLHRDEAQLASVDWANIVLDEAQNIKNPSTRAAQVARRLRSSWRVALTGTPIENQLSDLWSLFEFLDPGYLGSNEEFRRRFATPIERGGDSLASERLKTLISPLILRRLKTDRAIIADLPEKNEMKVFCTISREQATLYEAIVRDSVRMVEAAEGIQRRGLILAMIVKLKQVCDHPVLFLKDGSDLSGRSGKLARLEEMLEETVACGDRALIFTQFAEMGTLLRDHLQRRLDREVLFLHGGTPAAHRDRMVARFQADDHGPPVFILSIKAGGTGLNLTRANHVFHFDRWWNPAVENQATDRAFRIGQRRDVEVHKFICAGTFEEAIDELIERKIALSEAVVGTSENWITEMSSDELRGLLALRADAVQA